MEFEPYLGWIDVPDPNNPPPGARLIGASDLLRYERALEQAESEFAGLAARFAARTHTHSMSQVTGLTDAISTAANGARNTAQAFATGAVTTHNDSTTNVHGISNTANLVYTNDSRLTNARTPVTHSHPTSQVTGLESRLRAIESAATAAEADIGNIADAQDRAMAVVRHGSNASVDRPEVAAVYWIGSLLPTSGAADDLWLNTTNRELTVLDG